jgi:hypothetical protein
MSIELFKNNYLQTSGSGHSWHVKIDPPTRRVKSYYEETVETIEYVYANRTGKFTVFFSGGLDSQYVCEVLLKLGIDFDVVIIELQSSSGTIYNHHDIRWAYDFCHAKNLNPKTYDLDFDRFIKSDSIIDFAMSIRSGCSPLLPTLHVMNQIDGFILIGLDPPLLRYEQDKNCWFFEELELIHMIIRFFKKYNVQGCPYVLEYSAEMLLAFLLDPTTVKLGTNQLDSNLGPHEVKSHVFNNGSGLNMPVYDNKVRVKYHGHEKLPETIKQHPHFRSLNTLLPLCSGEYLEPYQHLVKRLSINQ